MTKEYYVDYVKKNFKGKTLKILLNQIENFYILSDEKLKTRRFVAGEKVKLLPNMYMHGFSNDRDIFDFYAQNGLINKDYLNDFGLSRYHVSYVASLWHIKKSIQLGDYIKLYSGITVEYVIRKNDKEKKFYELVPYKQLDNYVEKMRKVNNWKWKAESTMEIRFMPSLAKDDNQIAFIINGTDKKVQNYIKNDLHDYSLPFDVVKEFYNFKSKEEEQDFKNNRLNGKRARIAYILFGIPRSMIEGVLVGRKFEKNKKVLQHIKQQLPSCYICNLDGEVIVGNK